MSERTDSDLLGDIHESIHRIREYTREMDYDLFFSDIKTQDAVFRNLEVIGEATKALSLALRERHPDIPWKGMAGVRDRLIHHYFGVNIDIVWNIVALELPSVESQIEAIIRQERPGNEPDSKVKRR